MGGLGSGRSSTSGRATVEMCHSLDVNRLNRAGVLKNGWRGGWAWSRNGEQVASVSIRGGRDEILLTYRWRQPGIDWQDVAEAISIHWRSCRYGGSQPLFRCPGVSNGKACHRTVVKLYSAERYYLCRHCYRLTYASRREQHWDRALRRANRLRLKLGGEPGLAAELPERPRGMWRRTFEQRLREIRSAEEVASERLARLASRLLTFKSAAAKKCALREKFWR